jgi:hypothetical protein
MKKKLPVMIAGMVVLFVIGIFTYQYFQSRESVKVAEAVRQERQQWKEKTAALQQEVAALEQEILRHLQTPVPESRVAEAFGETAAKEDPDDIPRGDDCHAVEQRVRSFFKYLDARDYIRAAGLPKGSYGLFQDAATRLSAKPPLIAEEMRDLLHLLHNIAHFFRVLGKDRIFLVREILSREADILEPAMASFYAWHQIRGRCKMKLEGLPDLPVLYSYAGFLLQSLGGRSCLSRRDPVIRMVSTYYAILILDEANRAKINTDGIDIRPLIDISFREISGQKNLAYREHYLKNLARLRETYQI